MEPSGDVATKGTLLTRTKEFAKRIVLVVNEMPVSPAGIVIGKQLLRSATSVGANYRAACRSRSAKEFCARLGVVEEEADKSACWIELLVETGIFSERRMSLLLEEAKSITAMVVASIKTARRKAKESKARKSSPKPR
jgi:four helix bundle protein